MSAKFIFIFEKAAMNDLLAKNNLARSLLKTPEMADFIHEVYPS